jgi:hypothetical protein
MKHHLGFRALFAGLCLVASLSVNAAAVSSGDATAAKSQATSSLTGAKTTYRTRLTLLKNQLDGGNLSRSEYNKQIKLAKSQYNSDVKRINLVLYKKLNGYTNVASPS